MNQIDFIKINELLLKPNLHYQSTSQVVKKVQENLPLVHKKVFSFELNENIEPSRFVIALMEMCTSSMNSRKKAHPGPNKGAYEVPTHQAITQQNMHYVFQFGLNSIFTTNIVQSLTTSS